MPEELGLKAVTGARLIDGTGAGPVDKVTVVIEGKGIRAVGEDLPVPDGAEIIHADGKIVMPGLIDAHMHNMGKKQTSTRGIRPQELSLIKSIYDSKRLLAAGYTTIKDCGGRNSIFLRKAIAEGTLTGLPRIVAAGLIVVQTFNGMDNVFFPEECADARLSNQSEFLLCDGIDECTKGTRLALRYGADFIKIFASGNYSFDNNSINDVQFNLDELKTIVQTAAQAGKFVSAHCHNPLSAKNAILSGVKTIEHAIGVDDEVVELAKKHDAIFVSSMTILRSDMEDKSGPTPGSPPRYQDVWEDMRKGYMRIRHSGAVLAAGSDLNSTPQLPLGINATELELLVKYAGFTPMDAIVAATKNGAEACFIGDKTGTIQPGKLADIIIVDGDPLADIRVLQNLEKIKMVMLEGNIEINRGLFIAKQ